MRQKEKWIDVKIYSFPKLIEIFGRIVVGVDVSEKKLQAKILVKINRIPGCVAFANVVTAYSPTGHSDIYGSIYGYSFWAEVKLPGKEPTKIQKAFLESVGKESIIRNTFVWFSVEQAVKDIEQMDSMLDYYMD